MQMEVMINYRAEHFKRNLE